jgi:hypothetical protein
VKTFFDEIGYPLYCDAGPHEGKTRIDLTLRLYLSPDEHARYQGPESLRITLGGPGSEPGAPAGPSAGGPASAARRPARPLPAQAAPGSAAIADKHADGHP